MSSAKKRARTAAASVAPAPAAVAPAPAPAGAMPAHGQGWLYTTEAGPPFMADEPVACTGEDGCFTLDDLTRVLHCSHVGVMLSVATDEHTECMLLFDEDALARGKQAARLPSQLAEQLRGLVLYGDVLLIDTSE